MRVQAELADTQPGGRHMGGSNAVPRHRWFDDHDESLRDQADDFEDALRADMVNSGVITDW